jgi:hypothetical protein
MGLEISIQEQKLLATVSTTGHVTATQVGTTPLWRPRNGMELICDLSANAAGDVGDTLDITVQTNLAGLWTDVVHFTQILGNGGIKRFGAKLMTQTAFAIGDIATALTAGNIRHLFGDEWRVSYVIVDANDNSTFTFSIYAIPF